MGSGTARLSRNSRGSGGGGRRREGGWRDGSCRRSTCPEQVALPPTVPSYALSGTACYVLATHCPVLTCSMRLPDRVRSLYGSPPPSAFSPPTLPLSRSSAPPP
eukprot:1601512-Rhodomonas_salina.1